MGRTHHPSRNFSGRPRPLKSWRTVEELTEEPRFPREDAVGAGCVGTISSCGADLPRPVYCAGTWEC